MKHVLLNVPVILLVVGCGCRQEPASSAEQRPSTVPAVVSPEDPSPGVREPSVKTFNTGDSDTWQSYDLPLLIQIDVPGVPEGISKPSPPIPGAKTDGTCRLTGRRS